MKIQLCGVTRIVFIFKRFVIKIPNFTVEHNHFLCGCRDNWRERSYYKQWVKTDWHMKDMVAPSLFCTWFGLIQIQKRAVVLSRELTLDEIKVFGDLTTDTKGNNFGYIKDRLVCLDYA